MLRDSGARERELECKLEESSEGAQGKEMEEKEQGCGNWSASWRRAVRVRREKRWRKGSKGAREQ